MPDDGALERLETKLEGGKEALRRVRRTGMSERDSRAPHGWKPPDEKRMRPPTRFGLIEIIFGASIVFFIVAAGIAGLLFYSGNNTVSTKNVDVAISGPSEIGAGNTLSLQVVITNRNAVPMQLTDLVVEFPTGTRSDSDITVDLPRVRETLGTIDPGQSVNRTIRAVVFGQEGTSVSVKASAEYRIPSSNAIFVSEGGYVAKINQAPASIVVNALKETVSGQQVSMEVTVTSNAPQVLTDMLLIAQYPPGFTFASSAPTPVSGTGAWSLGDIEPGGTRKVTINGTFAGEDGDTRVIHFTAGNRQPNRVGEISAPLSSTDVSVSVTKPFVSVSLALDGTVASEHVIGRGKVIRGDVTWVNNLPVAAQDVEITLSMKGAIVDKTTVHSERGFFRSSDQVLTWSKETDPQLGNVAPGASDVESFEFATFPLGKGAFRNPELNFTVTVSARRLSETNVPETIQSNTEAHVVVATDLTLNSYLIHGAQDKGPNPPKAETETQYTVTWNAANSTNAVANAVVTATLPSYVKWTGALAPSDAAITYNPVGGIVTWTIGDIGENQSKTVSFQISFTPSVSQVGALPTIVSDQRANGFDRFARSAIEAGAEPLTTVSAVPVGQNGLVVP